MLFLTTKSGKVSKINLFILAVAIVGLIQIWFPFLPEVIRVYQVPIILTVTFLIRTFSPQSGPINTGL